MNTAFCSSFSLKESILEIFTQVQQLRTFADAKAFLSSLCEITPNISRAIVCAQENHEGQFRKSGEPYIVHPLCVACLTAFYGGDEAMVCAALLHDVVEDTEINLDNVKKDFGEAVALLVDGLTKIDEIREEELGAKSANQRLAISALTFRKMLIAAVNDPRVLVIKISDRLHNMLTLDSLSEEKRLRIAKETLVVYAPIAHRLGISSIKNELEDKSFFYIFPQEYAKIQDFLKDNNQPLTLQLNDFSQTIQALLLRNGFTESSFKLEYRIKRPYSMYLKMQRKGIGIDEILDLLAMRVLVGNVLDCYKVLGIVHSEFKPIISRFKDYIALPKENAYQTIHTTVFDKSRVFEVQIRTFDMHKNAEFGVAAHWKYKSDGSISPSLEWLQNLQYQNNDIEEFYELAKNDLYREDIVVFSPDGDTFSLPLGAVALDYAYLIHTKLGDHAKTAYINNQESSLLQRLKSGDIVRILSDPQENPKCTWIDAVKTSRAKNQLKIQAQNRIKEVEKKAAINILATIFSKDPTIFGRYLSIRGLDRDLVRCVNDEAYLLKMCEKIKSSFAIGSNPFVKIRFNMLKPKHIELDNFIFCSNHTINGVGFDYCCRPKYGDSIMGVLTSQKVIVHHKLCDKLKDIIKEGQTMVQTKWAQINKHAYKVIVSLEDKQGMLSTFINTLAKQGCNVLSINYSGYNSQTASYCEVIFDTEDKNYKKIKDILSTKFSIIEFSNFKDAYKS